MEDGPPASFLVKKLVDRPQSLIVNKKLNKQASQPASHGEERPNWQ
jgi:hypothetical protein